MDSTLILRIHTISVTLFLLTYVIKTTLLLSSKNMLDKYSRITKVPEMIISVLFLVSGIWLFVIIGGIKYLQIVKLICVVISIPLAIIGFKKYKYGMALIAMILIIAAYGLAEMSKNKVFIPAKAELSPGNNSPFAQGALIFYQNCAFCHGADGKKMYRNAPDLTVSKLNEGAIEQAIREGSRNKMPSYNIIMSDENIAAVAKYVNSLHPLQIDTVQN